MKNVTWFIRSSSDPQKVSMAVLAALLGIIPITMQVFSLTCGLQIVCVDVTGSELKTIAETFANLTFLVLSAVSTVGVLWGLLRKLWSGRWAAPPDVN